jgi:hypothetical protein
MCARPRFRKDRRVNVAAGSRRVGRDNSVSFNFNMPFRIYKARHLDEGEGWSNIGETFSVRPRGFFPFADVGQQNPSPYYICE